MLSKQPKTNEKNVGYIAASAALFERKKREQNTSEMRLFAIQTEEMSAKNVIS